MTSIQPFTSREDSDGAMHKLQGVWVGGGGCRQRDERGGGDNLPALPRHREG